MRSGASEWQDGWASPLTAPTKLTISVSEYDHPYCLYFSLTHDCVLPCLILELLDLE